MMDKWLLFAACLYVINAVGWVVFITWRALL